MARKYDENQGSMESLRDIKMPVVKSVRPADSYYMGSNRDLGEKDYLREKDGIASKDAAKLRKYKDGMKHGV